MGRGVQGTAFPFAPGSQHDGGRVGFPLEKCGPGGEILDPSSNRAKLRAVIAALEFRDWQEEGWRRVVIATDLQYVVYGATRWLSTWVRRRWRTRKNKKVANRDLWEELNGIIENLRDSGTEVSFWLIPPGSAIKKDSALTRQTKDAAREAATAHQDEAAFEFTRLCGIRV